MYHAFFGLTGPAFRLSPDPSFLFESPGHAVALQYLKYGIHQGEGIVVLTGEIGAGKTTVLQALVNMLPPDRVLIAQVVSTQLDELDLLRAVALEFGLVDVDGHKAHLIRKIHSLLKVAHAEGRRALLLVDEAQNLTPAALEELRMLSNFQVGSVPLLQSFLLGQPELRAKLRRPEMAQFQQRVIASCYLSGLRSANETGAYFRHRLQRVGWTGDPHIGDGVMEQIHAASGGLPRRINLIGERLLLAAFLAGEHELTAAATDAVLAEIAAERGDAAAWVGR